MRELGSQQPTAVELEILRILWEIEPAGVRSIHEQLQVVKKSNYSTTVKMLSLMLHKGLVTRDEASTPHQYSSALSREQAGKSFVHELVEKIYSGSSMSLVLQALDGGKASPDEIAKVRKILDDMEQRS